MSCIAPERFVEWLEQGGLEAVTDDEASHLRSCGDCRETWARLSAADNVLQQPPVSASRSGRLPAFAAFAAAAAVLMAVAFALWTPPAGDRAVPGQSQDPPKYSPMPSEGPTGAPRPAPRFMVTVSAKIHEGALPGDDHCRWQKVGNLSELPGLGPEKGGPALAMFDGQLSHLISVDQAAYVSGYDVKISGDGRIYTPDPRVAIARSGYGLEVRPVVVDAAAGIVKLASFKVYLWDREAKPRKIETRQGSAEDQDELTVTYSTETTLAKGETLVFGPLISPLGKQPVRYLSVTCTIQPATDKETLGGVIQDFPIESR